MIERPVYCAEYCVRRRKAPDVDDVQKSNGKCGDGKFEDDRDGVHEVEVGVFEVEVVAVEAREERREVDGSDDDRSRRHDAVQEPDELRVARNRRRWSGVRHCSADRKNIAHFTAAKIVVQRHFQHK